MENKIVTEELILKYMNEGKKLFEPTVIKGIKVVQDINEAKKAVLNGETVTRYEFGDSLEPFVHSGEYLILKPIDDETALKIGDIVLCKCCGYLMTHMIVDILSYENNGKNITNYLIGNGKNTSIFGFSNEIYAKCSSFGDKLEDREFVEFK